MLSIALLTTALLHGPLSAAVQTRQTSITMLAKKSKSKKPAASSGGGFGAPKAAPPTLQEVCDVWKTRLPSDYEAHCVCGSGISYAKCCLPYHKGEKLPESPEHCLRSRYAAFAYRLPEYIIRSTDKTNSDYSADKIKWAKRLNKESMFDSFKFVGLEVGELEEGSKETEQFLSLRVTLMPIDAAGLPKQADPMVFSERSKFLRSSKGAWLYAAGEVTTEAAGFKGRVLNKESDLESMKTDVDYVNKLIKEKAPPQ